MMFSVMDIILAAVLVIFAVRGYRRGFVRAVTGFLTLAASFIMAWLLFKPVAQFLNSTPIRPWIEGMVLSHYVEPGVREAGGAFGSLPEALKAMADSGISAFSEVMGSHVTNLVMNVISFVAVLILVKVLIFVAMRILGILTSLPVLGLFNKLLGLLGGALSGIAVIYIALALCYAAPPVHDSPAFRYAMERSAAAQKMYINNPIVGWFTTSADGK